MSNILEKIGQIGIVPVIRIDRVEDAVPLAKALCEGGLPCAEITFRTDAAEESIRRITQEIPDMLVGAGTVLTIDQLDKAIAAGAKFIVSPGLNPKIVQACIDRGILITPGCSNPSDIEAALELGLTTVKFFPAEASGGLNAIKAMAAPYVNVTFMPTGGINAKNINSYLAFDRIVACGGSWMVDPALVAAGDFAAITKLTREAVQTMLGFSLMHVGINCENSAEAEATAKLFCVAFGLEYKPGNSSVFAGTAIETMKTPYLGKNGHIAFGTNSITRAYNYLKGQGIKFNEESAKYDAKGKLLAIYFAEEFGGFAIHLLQKK